MSDALITRVRGGLIAIVIAVLALGTYAVYEHGQARRLSAENQQVASALHNTQGELDSLNSKITALTEQEQARRADEARAAAARQSAAHSQAARAHVRKDDPRWKQFQQRLDENGQAIESTRQDLASAKTELSGSIARTHDELVLLQKKGERNYYEFDLSKTKQFAAKGPVGIKLRKVNTKHQFADLDLMVDDVDLQKKHVNLYEPVVFYASDSGVPIELVINGISKDHIRGYVSEPKYKRSELTAQANDNAASGGAADAGSAPPQRHRLQLPK
jgi:uncharacterized lipoprotein NlpE involved in copper resistance